jgi:multidrug efflux pump subunit AcrA (membrane-fusion protein)
MLQDRVAVVDEHVQVGQRAGHRAPGAAFHTAVRRPITATPTAAPSAICVSESMDIARAQRDSARAAATAQRADGAEGLAAVAQWQAAQAAVQVARARLDQTALRAPADGRVLLRAVEPGQIVQPGRALLAGVRAPCNWWRWSTNATWASCNWARQASVLADAFPGQRLPGDRAADRTRWSTRSAVRST